MKSTILKSFILGIILLNSIAAYAQTNIKWEETFSDSIAPAGWHVIDNDESGVGLELDQSFTTQGGQTVYPHTGQHLWSSNYENANLAGVIDEWLISPQISVIYAGDSLYFWAGAIGGSFDDSLRVFVSTTGNQISDFNHLIGYFKVDGPVGSWHKYGFNLAAFDSSDIYFAINYYIKDGGLGGQHSDFVWIDHCFITGDPSTINQPPTEFNLLEPTNYSLLHPLADSTIYFKWNSSYNADNDTLKYRLEILDIFPTLVFNNITDTTFAFDWHGFLNHYAVYRWSVSVTDGKSTVFSPDTFLFITPPIENLAPFPFSLASPENGDTLSLADTINFKWHRAIDPNSDTLIYELNISGSNLDTTFRGISDTLYTIFAGNILQEGNTYNWTVTALDTQFSTNSVNTWQIIIGSVNSIVDLETIPPTKFTLKQNFPNPFNPVTSIQFDLPQSENVVLTIFDTQGRQIETLVNDYLNAGRYRYQWKPQGLASGLYYYRIETGAFKKVMKLMYIK